MAEEKGFDCRYALHEHLFSNAVLHSASPRDISWNKMRLKQQGHAVPAAIRRPKEAAA
jgi:hypothetical protein